NRRFSLDARFPKSNDQPAVSTLLVIVPFSDPGPELDDLVYSLLLQSCDSFRVVFLYCDSVTDHAPRLPLTDSRFSLTRYKEVRPWRTCVTDYVRARVKNEIVLVLPPQSRLAEK